MKPNKYLEDVLGGELGRLDDETISEISSSSNADEIYRKKKKKDSSCFHCGCLTISFLAALYFGGNYLVNKYIEQIYDDGNASVYREPEKKLIKSEKNKPNIKEVVEEQKPKIDETPIEESEKPIITETPAQPNIEESSMPNEKGGLVTYTAQDIANIVFLTEEEAKNMGYKDFNIFRANLFDKTDILQRYAKIDTQNQRLEYYDFNLFIDQQEQIWQEYIFSVADWPGLTDETPFNIDVMEGLSFKVERKRIKGLPSDERFLNLDWITLGAGIKLQDRNGFIAGLIKYEHLEIAERLIKSLFKKRNLRSLTDALFLLVDAYGQKGRMKEKEELLLFAYEERIGRGGGIECLNALAEHYRLCGEDDKALALLLSAYEERIGSVGGLECLNALAEHYRLHNEEDKALTLFDKTIREAKGSDRIKDMIEYSIERANFYREIGRIDDAAKEFRILEEVFRQNHDSIIFAKDLEPKFAFAFCSVADDYNEEGQFAEALEWYQKAMQMVEGNSLFRESLESKITHNVPGKISLIERRLAAEETVELQNILKTKLEEETTLEDIIQRSNKLALEGSNLMEEKKYDLAIQKLNEAIELNPNNAVYFNNRGYAYFLKSDWDNAIQDYSKAIELNPNDAVHFNNRGSAYFRKKDYDNVIQDFNKAIELNPNEAVYFNWRGVAHYRKNDYDNAIQDFNKAIELNPNNAVYFNNRGDAYFGKSDRGNAIQDYSKAIELNPNDAEYFNNRGNAYFRKSDWVNAIQDYSKAIELNPNEAVYFNNRGNAYKEKGDIKRAEEDWKKAKQLRQLK